MEQLSAQVHKLIDELDEVADNRTAFRSESNRIGCVGADFFIGIKVAEIRKVAERYVNICLDEIEQYTRRIFYCTLLYSLVNFIFLLYKCS